MRPQHITAENRRLLRRVGCGSDAASMRPQHITAENLLNGWSCTVDVVSFNEAAAYHCGKPEPVVAHFVSQMRASMRPQHITAENVSQCGCAAIQPPTLQ